MSQALEDPKAHLGLQEGEDAERRAAHVRRLRDGQNRASQRPRLTIVMPTDDEIRLATEARIGRQLTQTGRLMETKTLDPAKDPPSHTLPGVTIPANPPAGPEVADKRPRAPRRPVTDLVALNRAGVILNALPADKAALVLAALAEPRAPEVADAIGACEKLLGFLSVEGRKRVLGFLNTSASLKDGEA